MVCVIMALHFGSFSVLLRVHVGALVLASSCVLFPARSDTSIAPPFRPSRGLESSEWMVVCFIMALHFSSFSLLLRVHV